VPVAESTGQIARVARDGATNGEITYARRKFLAGAIAAIQAAVAGTLAFVLGGSVLSPSFARRRERWLPAGSIAELPDNEPVPVTLRVERDDGYARVVDRQVVFLVRTGASGVTALSSVCTHLGCRVSWNAEAQELRCPCHGGVFDRGGAVKAGPPPAPLATLPAKIEGEGVLVQV
jgi:Rieske Fe-S protein